MPRFKDGDKVQLNRPPFLHKGVFVLPSAILTVQKTRAAESGETAYEVLYFDKEMLSHVIPLKESELKAAAPEPPQKKTT